MRTSPQDACCFKLKLRKMGTNCFFCYALRVSFGKHTNLLLTYAHCYMYPNALHRYQSSFSLRFYMATLRTYKSPLRALVIVKNCASTAEAGGFTVLACPVYISNSTEGQFGAAVEVTLPTSHVQLASCGTAPCLHHPQAVLFNLFSQYQVSSHMLHRGWHIS